MRLFFAVLSALLALAIWMIAVPVDAATCGPFDLVRSRLAERFGEVPVGGGLAGDRELLAVFASADGATWTLVSVRPGGMACVLAAGSGWMDLSPPAEPKTEKERL